MLTIGCHLSVSKGFCAMGKEALKINANTFQFFTRNPRGSKAKDIDEKDIEEFLILAKQNNFGVLLAHAPYTLNPCSKDQCTREFAWQTMEDDLKRMEYLPNNMYNFHPGSHVGQGIDIGIEQIIQMLNSIIKPQQKTTILLETMSGKGTEVGSRFEEISAIIEGVKFKEKIGVCLDTCHVHDAGYDIVNNLDKVIEEFDSVIGLDYLKAIHLNDSMNICQSHKDRHQKIGMGEIGFNALAAVINHPRLRKLPFYLETPNELDGYKEEIKVLREAYHC